MTKKESTTCLYKSEEEIHCNGFECGKTKTSCKFKTRGRKCEKSKKEEES